MEGRADEEAATGVGGEAGPDSWPPLDDAENTYRLLVRPTDLTTQGGITSKAFLLRQVKPDGSEADKDGLSVSLCGGRPESQLVEEERVKVTRCVGVGRITAVDIRGATVSHGWPLDVVQDEAYHANVKGLPRRPADLTTEEGRVAQLNAEFVGNELAKRARLAWKP